MDIKLTLNSRSKVRSQSIEAEAQWMESQGPLYYPLPAKPRQAHVGSWVYFIRNGRVVAKSKIKSVVPTKALPKGLRTYTGRRIKAGRWNLECSRMTLTCSRVNHPGFQGFRYVTPDEAQKFEHAFRRGTDATHAQMIYEGAVRQILKDTVIRNPRARQLCIQHHGSSCVICKINFGAKYGPGADDFIHVHHLRPLGKAKGKRCTDPIRDLRPICPNCHAVIHLGAKSTISDVKRQIEEQSNKLRRV